MLPRPPRSTRTDTLFPYTTLFRSRHNRGAVHLIDWLLADHRKDMVLKAGNPVGMAPVLPALLQCFVTVTRGLLKIRNDFAGLAPLGDRSEEHTSELQSLMRISYAVFCLKKKTQMNKSTS